MQYLRRTWADVDLDAIKQNFCTLKERLTPGCRTMAVVKADAYGHGDGHVARVLSKQGADWFAVSNINEAASLRRQGITEPVLILGYTPPALAGQLAELAASQTVFSAEYANELSTAAQKAQVTLDCHIKADTGMGRIGFFAQQGREMQAADEIVVACHLPGLSCTGIFTHFACADEFSEDSRAFTREQFAVFSRLLRELEGYGCRFQLRHCCNSAAAISYPEMHLDMVRLGVALYGLQPSHDCAGLVELRAAMSLYTTVTMTKTLAAGTPVGYGRAYTTTREGERVASIAVGYADGYHRIFSNRARVIVEGAYAPVIGRVCMDQTMIDVSEAPQVHAGSVVTLVGRCGEKAVTLDEFAALGGTINYEEACQIGRRVPRVYIEDGRECAVLDYILPAYESVAASVHGG